MEYNKTIERFYLVFENATVNELIVENNKATVIANYDLISSNGKKMNLDIAEIWTVKDDKLNSLVIYFDTATWNQFFKPDAIQHPDG